MKASKSAKKRIKRTPTGKIRRRSTALGHNKANKRSVQKSRKKQERGFVISKKTIAKYI